MFVGLICVGVAVLLSTAGAVPPPGFHAVYSNTLSPSVTPCRQVSVFAGRHRAAPVANRIGSFPCLPGAGYSPVWAVSTSAPIRVCMPISTTALSLAALPCRTLLPRHLLEPTAHSATIPAPSSKMFQLASRGVSNATTTITA